MMGGIRALIVIAASQRDGEHVVRAGAGEGLQRSCEDLGGHHRAHMGRACGGWTGALAWPRSVDFYL